MTAIPTRQTNTKTFRIAFAVLALCLLATPLIAMQFTGEVDWKAGDFLLFGAMLTALGCTIDLVIRYLGDRWLRVTAIALAIASFIVLWAMLATG